MSGWTPVALAADLPPGTVAGVVLRSEEIVLWRDGAGPPHAWKDRCPHRGMKLSFGFVRRDRLVCLYHGWEYGADTRCALIPAHPDLDVPETIRATPWQVAETGGLLWVGSRDAGQPPDLPEAMPLRSLFLDAPLDTARTRLRSGGLPGLGEVDLIGDGPLLRFAQGGHLFAVGGHEIGPAACALHLTSDGTAAARAALVPATAALRREVRAQSRGAAA